MLILLGRMQLLTIIIGLFIIFLLSTLSLSYYNQTYADLVKMRSAVDNNEYLVRQVDDVRYPSSKAADILATLRAKCSEFIAYLKNKYPLRREEAKGIEQKTNDDHENTIFVDRLAKNFRPNAFSESSAFQQGTSYSVNKGEKIVLCLRQKPSNEFVDMNTLTYVVLHELAHLGTIEDKPHTPIYDRNFRFILNEAVDQQLYEYRPYHLQPIPYCGKMITDTPLRFNKSST